MSKQFSELTEEEIRENDRIAAEEYKAYLESCDAEEKAREEDEPTWFGFGFGFRF